MLVGCLILAAAAAVLVVGFCLATRGPTDVALSDSPSPADRSQQNKPAGGQRRSLTVMTLNLAHGRKDGAHQALLSPETIRSNLDGVAAMLADGKPDVVALQEADGPSIWSGNFNHVEYLAREAGFPHCLRGEHVRGMKLSYGTALLSRLPMADGRSVTFPSSPPTLTKGYVSATLAWPGDPDARVCVVSVHLDFSRQSVRQQQVREMVTRLSKLEVPLIVVGDFNDSWQPDSEQQNSEQRAENPLRYLARELDLRPYEPAAEELGTFVSSDRRLDWILISPSLEFVEYENVAEVVSDHRAVVAELKMAENP